MKIVILALHTEKVDRRQGKAGFAALIARPKHLKRRSRKEMASRWVRGVQV